MNLLLTKPEQVFFGLSKPEYLKKRPRLDICFKETIACSVKLCSNFSKKAWDFLEASEGCQIRLMDTITGLVEIRFGVVNLNLWV